MYILDYNRQLDLIREMTLLRKDADNWVVYYHHPFTNEMWKSYFPRATKRQRGPKILRIEPVPEKLEDRLDGCLKSTMEENAIGLGIELSVEPDQWEQIIALIETRYRSYNRKQLRLFLRYSGIESPDELFEEIERSPEDYGLDAEQLRDLARKSRIVRFKRFWFF